jgi:hypothetical protein
MASLINTTSYFDASNSGHSYKWRSNCLNCLFVCLFVLCGHFYEKCTFVFFLFPHFYVYMCFVSHFCFFSLIMTYILLTELIFLCVNINILIYIEFIPSDVECYTKRKGSYLKWYCTTDASRRVLMIGVIKLIWLQRDNRRKKLKNIKMVSGKNFSLVFNLLLPSRMIQHNWMMLQHHF